MQTSLHTLRGHADARVPSAPPPESTAITLPNVRDLFDRWLAARSVLRIYNGSSCEPAARVASAREHCARVALVAARARSVDDIVAHLGTVAILARGVEGLDAEIEADVITNTADIRTFAMRIVMDILVLGVDIVPPRSARTGEVADV